MDRVERCEQVLAILVKRVLGEELPLDQMPVDPQAQMVLERVVGPEMGEFAQTVTHTINMLGQKVHQLETDALRCRQMEADMAALLQALSRYEVDETSGRLRKVG